jgi:hypothetical protein
VTILVAGSASHKRAGGRMIETSFSRPTIRELERFPIELNRLGFPNQAGSDSNCLLAKEAGRHGTTSFD